MNLPVIGLGLVLVVWIQFVPQLSAQAVSIFASTESSTSSSSSSSLTPSPSTSSMDFSALSWRFGRMSPFTQQPISSSSTTQTSVPSPTISTSDANLFVGTTLGMRGTLNTSGTASSTSSSSIAITQPVDVGSIGTVISPAFVPRFITVHNSISTIGADSTIDPIASAAVMNFSQFTPSAATDASSFASVPEPGTIAMCCGLLALVGYGYSRRRLKVENKTKEVPETENEKSETNEAVTV